MQERLAKLDHKKAVLYNIKNNGNARNLIHTPHCIWLFGTSVNRRNDYIMKRFPLYSNYTTYFILGGLGVGHLCSLGLSIHFYSRYCQDGDVSWFLGIFMVLGLWVAIDLYGYKMLRRFLLFCSFDSQGIHYRGLLWRQEIIPWDDIHAYGTASNSYSYVSCSIIFLSTDAQEHIQDPKQLFVVNDSRLIFEIRKDLIDALFCYMPEDMKKKLQYVISRKENSFFRR